MKKTRSKTTTKRPAVRGRSRPPTKAKSSRQATPAVPIVEAIPEPSPAVPDALSAAPEIIITDPEREFAARALPADPDRPLPAGRRAIFFDVENTSRAEHIARVIDHLAVDRMGRRTDFVAVGNWKVIGLDTARLLARHGAQLVHSAPSVGVRDWSDLRIAVAAGVWLAGGRPGDVMEIVTNDRAFDAVGDVASGLGIAFRRLSYQGLAGAPAPAALATEEAPREPRGDASGRRRRRGRRHSWRESAPPAAAATPAARPPSAPSPPPSAPVPPPVAPDLPRTAATSNGAEGSPAEPHTAPHDEIVSLVQDLIQRAPGRAVTIDTLANALKSRGFSRTPGSPRLITRLRRIREITVNRSGMITLVSPGERAPEDRPTQDEMPAPRESPVEDRQPEVSEASVAFETVPAPGEEVAPTPPRRSSEWEEEPGDSIGNVAPPPGTQAPPRRQAPHRGGRRRFPPRSQRASAV